MIYIHQTNECIFTTQGVSLMSVFHLCIYDHINVDIQMGPDSDHIDMSDCFVTLSLHQLTHTHMHTLPVCIHTVDVRNYIGCSQCDTAAGHHVTMVTSGVY